MLHHAADAVELLAQLTLPQSDQHHIDEHDQPRGAKAEEHVLDVSIHWACAILRRVSISRANDSWRIRTITRMAEKQASASRFHQMGASMPSAMPPPLRIESTGWGCWVFHHSIDL